MTRILKSTIAAAALAIPAALSAADYTVFRVCEDQHVLRTSDGAEAGRVEYIVFEPTSHRVVSAIVTGGIVAEKHIAVPMTAFQFGAERQVTLTNITRERLVAAPAFEVTQLRSRAVIEPALVERTYTHFGLNAADITRSSTTTERNATSTSTTINDRNNDPAANRPNAPARTSTETAIDPANRDATNPNTTTPPKPGDASKDDAAPGSARKNRDASDRSTRPAGTTSDPASTRPNRSDSTPDAKESAPDRSNTPPKGQDEKAPGASPNKNQKDNADAARSDSPSSRSNSDSAPGATKPDASGNAKSGSERNEQSPKESKESSASKAANENDSKPKSDPKKERE